MSEPKGHFTRRVIFILCIVAVVIIVAAGIGTPVCADGTTGTVEKHGVMHLTQAQMKEMWNETNALPLFSPQNGSAMSAKSVRTSFSLLPYLVYNASERDQGTCGNCWVWATTGAMEIEHSLRYGTADRLSIQYFDEIWGDGPKGDGSACSGGWPSEVATTYSYNKVIPWSNRNAGYADGSGTVQTDTYRSMATLPAYQLNAVTTRRVSNNASYIKSALDSGHPVIMQFWLSRSDWNTFYDFWDSQPETAIWDPTSCADTGWGAGHAVIIVGYDFTDPDNPYWIVLNSWGAPANRPDGTFRLTTKMDYTVMDYEGYLQYVFETVNPGFRDTSPPPPAVAGTSPYSGPTGGGNTVTISGIGFTGATAVSFDGAPATSFTVTSDSTIKATVPAEPWTTQYIRSGNAVVIVTTPAGTSASSADSTYTYEGPPVVTGVSPATGSTNGGNNVTITGSDLYGTTAVVFGRQLRATNVMSVSDCSDSLLGILCVMGNHYVVTATVPAESKVDQLLQGRTVSVTVITPSGISDKSDADVYQYVPVPEITGISPDSGPAGSAVTITGSGFDGTTNVTFGNMPATSFNVTGDSTITATVPDEPEEAGLFMSSRVRVTIMAPVGGTSPFSAAGQFAYREVPAIAPYNVTPVRTGSIAVTSDPGGAAVSLDGTGTGQVTPCMLGPVVPGDHVVTASHAGYNPENMTVTVTTGSTATADFQFVRIHAGSQPVYTLGVTPAGQETSSAITTSNQGGYLVAAPTMYTRTGTTATVTPVVTKTVAVNTNIQRVTIPKTGSLVVTSTPAGAAIWINGQDAGQVTPYTFTEDSGTYHIVAKLKCYTTPDTQTVTVSPASMATAEFRLTSDATCNPVKVVTRTVIR
jgi:hypothetical protein